MNNCHWCCSFHGLWLFQALKPWRQCQLQKSVYHRWISSNYGKKEQLQGAASSACFSLVIDETTDVAVLNEMVIYARYIKNGKVVTNFLKICKLFSGTAGAIETTLVAYMEDKGLSMSKMVGLGTDGASVNTMELVRGSNGANQFLPPSTVCAIVERLQQLKLEMMCHTFVTNSSQHYRSSFTFTTTVPSGCLDCKKLRSCWNLQN